VVVDAGSPDDMARAVLRDGVLFIEETRDEWTRAIDGDEWTVRQAGSGLRVGSVLWLADAAVRITRVDTRAGATVLSVEEVGLAELFQTLSLAEDFDLSAAVWDTDEPGAAIEDVEVASEKAPNYTKFTRRLKLPVPDSWQESSLKMELSLGLGGRIEFDFEGDADTPPHGRIEIAAGVEHTFSVSEGASVSLESKEYKFKSPVRIPIKVGVFDSALRAVGVRALEIVIPIRIGAEVKFSSSMDVPLRLTSSIAATASFHYDADQGFGADGDITPESALQLGSPKNTPLKSSSHDVRLGGYVRALPTLQLINGVGALGLDLKVGGYAHGNIASYIIPPPVYFCYKVTPEARGEISGVFEALGFDKKETDPSPLPLWEGEPLTKECTRDAGDASADASETVLDASVTEAGADAGAPPPKQLSCGKNERYKVTVTGAWNDEVVDTETGLTWHRTNERVSGLPVCSPPLGWSASEEPVCCKSGGADPTYGKCNWAGAQKLCQDQGMRLASVDELKAMNTASGTCASTVDDELKNCPVCFLSWESWSSTATTPGAYYYARSRELGLTDRSGLMSFAGNTPYGIWGVKCVRDP
jgi:hypothetical protein